MLVQLPQALPVIFPQNRGEILDKCAFAPMWSEALEVACHRLLQVFEPPMITNFGEQVDGGDRPERRYSWATVRRSCL
jgi:hypothetical protein